MSNYPRCSLAGHVHGLLVPHEGGHLTQGCSCVYLQSLDNLPGKWALSFERRKKENKYLFPKLDLNFFFKAPKNHLGLAESWAL